jgi:hypothetical protein
MKTDATECWCMACMPVSGEIGLECKKGKTDTTEVGLPEGWEFLESRIMIVRPSKTATTVTTIEGVAMHPLRALQEAIQYAKRSDKENGR